MATARRWIEIERNLCWQPLDFLSIALDVRQLSNWEPQRTEINYSA